MHAMTMNHSPLSCTFCDEQSILLTNYFYAIMHTFEHSIKYLSVVPRQLDFRYFSPYCAYHVAFLQV